MNKPKSMLELDDNNKVVGLKDKKGKKGKTVKMNARVMSRVLSHAYLQHQAGDGKDSPLQFNSEQLSAIRGKKISPDSRFLRKLGQRMFRDVFLDMLVTTSSRKEAEWFVIILPADLATSNTASIAVFSDISQLLATYRKGKNEYKKDLLDQLNPGTQQA